MSEPVVLTSTADGVRRLTLNRPDQLNALSKELVAELLTAAADAADDPQVKVVVVAGAGRSLCAGYDLTEELTEHPGELERVLRQDLDRLLTIFDLPKPVIARVQGHCLAGGCDLMMMCDVVVAADDAVFGLPEITFGSAPVANVLPWLVGARRAKELMLSGERIDGREAHRIGLVNRVVDAAELDEEVDRIARRLATFDAGALRLTKEMVNRTLDAAGFRRALGESVALSAIIEGSRAPERSEFDRIREEQGLGAAIAWREKRLGD
ncbi:MAG TPA: enoyl-CoA hydratase/isomerase family protein [Acidimicrobiia bacterium]|nr:enoyl-CoA hydratase/isomerase family protein [Acidimicrobiia bacterium]